MKRGISVLAVIGVGGLLAAGLAVGASELKPPFVRVAHGQVAGHAWGLSMAERHSKRCYRLKLVGNTVQGISVGCASDRRPTSDWAEVTGMTTEGTSVVLAITKKRVHSVRLRVRHPHSHIEPGWLRVNTHRLSFAEAREAEVKRNFRFAVFGSRGNLCVTKAVLFDGSGSPIKRLTTPCEW
jgi:hypothetical protein